MSRGSGIIPDESMFAEFKRQCLSTENWDNKYDKNDIVVWVEQAPFSASIKNKGNYCKVHKIRVRCLPTFNQTVFDMCVCDIVKEYLNKCFQPLHNSIVIHEQNNKLGVGEVGEMTCIMIFLMI